MSGRRVVDPFVDKDTLLICRVCKWIGEAYLWVLNDSPGGSSAKVDIAVATCVACQEQGRVRELNSRHGVRTHRSVTSSDKRSKSKVRTLTA
jgi:hypothetical protein